MVVEYIRYSIDSERAQAFEQPYRRAAAALDASEHCERYEVSRRSGDPTQYVVRLEWDSEEGHPSQFRRSTEFRPLHGQEECAHAALAKPWCGEASLVILSDTTTA